MPENRSAPQPPRWRQIYDGIERQLSHSDRGADRLEVFGTVLRVRDTVRRTVRDRITRATASTGTCSIFPPEAMSRASCREIGACQPTAVPQVQIEASRVRGSGTN
jgi:hypothetical protein